MSTQPPPFPPFPVQTSHGGATAALVLGILGLSMVPGASVAAWVIGVSALRDMDARPDVAWGNRDHAKVGKILGIVGTIVLAVSLALVLAYFAVMALIVFGTST